MFSWAAKTVLILTALAPIAIVYAYVTGVEGYHIISMILCGVCIFLGMALLYILFFSEKYLEKLDLTITSVEPVDQENTSYLLLYLSPLFFSEIGSMNLHVVIPALFIYALITSTSYSYHYNPLISLMGWHFYKVGTPEGVTYVILTRKKINNIDRIKKVGQLTEYTFIDFSEK